MGRWRNTACCPVALVELGEVEVSRFGHLQAQHISHHYTMRLFPPCLTVGVVVWSQRGAPLCHRSGGWATWPHGHSHT